MFGTHFYNETIKRSVSIFGTLFNNITVKKVKSDNTVLTSQIVPISYGPKQKWLSRLNDEPNLSDGMRSSISLPRIAFEISGFEYDATRQQNKLIRASKTTLDTDNTKRSFQYAPAPYNINFTLSILAKNANDALQILEQILPYFQPEYTVSMKMVDSMTEVRDVPISLNSVTMNDEYEGTFEERRVIEYTLDFTMKLYFFGPVYTGKIIKNVIERTYLTNENGQFTSSQIDESGLIKEVKHYEPAFAETSNAVAASTTVTFATAINSSISVNDEVFGTNLTTNPTVSSIASDKLSVVLSSAITISANTSLKFVGSVDPEATFVFSYRCELNMPKDIDSKLDGVLDISTEITKEIKRETKIVKLPSRSESMDNDYKYGRETLYGLVERGQDAIDGILDLCKETEHPRAYEVAGQLIKTVGDTAEKLLDLQKKIKELEKEDEQKIGQQHNHLYVGSTSELQKFLKKNKE